MNIIFCRSSAVFVFSSTDCSVNKWSSDVQASQQRVFSLVCMVLPKHHSVCSCFCFWKGAFCSEYVKACLPSCAFPLTVAVAGRQDRCVIDSFLGPSDDVAGGKRALRFFSKSHLQKQSRGTGHFRQNRLLSSWSSALTITAA